MKRNQNLKPIGRKVINGQLIVIYPNNKIEKQIKAELREDWRISCDRCGDDRPPEIRV